MLEGSVAFLVEENKKLSKELKYCQQLLNALLTGNMPEHSDFTTFLYAVRGRGYLNYLDMKEQSCEKHNEKQN